MLYTIVAMAMAMAIAQQKSSHKEIQFQNENMQNDKTVEYFYLSGSCLFILNMFLFLYRFARNYFVLPIHHKHWNVDYPA